MSEKNISADGATKLGIHSVKNLLGSEGQMSLFSEHDVKFSEEFGIKLEGKIDRFGIDLTDIQARVMEGILRGFSETNYEGNLAPKEVKTLAEEKFSGKIPKSYEYVHQIPRLRVTQSQLLDWSGADRGSIASVQRTLEALSSLGTKQYCFYYDRLVLDEEKNPVKDKKGDWVMEEVYCIDTLFTVREIRSPQSGQLSYYEISPSSIFLDQRENYFMLVPFNWREEVKDLVGNKKASSYTFRFLMFLRYQYEIKRRYNKPKPYQIKWTPEEIAIAIKMPESVYKGKKKRAYEILEDAYQVARSLGYLLEYERGECIDTLTLNEGKYYNPAGSSDQAINEAILKLGRPSEVHPDRVLLQFYYNQIRTIDPTRAIPSEGKRIEELTEFSTLLEKRSMNDVKRLISWAFSHKYWCSKISTPEKLRKNFNEAWIELEVNEKVDPERQKEMNRSLAQKIEAGLKGKVDMNISACNGYLEFSKGTHSVILEYKSRSFLEDLSGHLQKIGHSIEAFT